MTWNKRLKKAREDMIPRMSKSEFARAVEVSPATVTNWENGKVTDLKGPNLMKVCAVLGISEAYLMDGVDEDGSRGRSKTRLTLVLDLKCETAAELRLLTAYRLAGVRDQIALNHAVDAILERSAANRADKPQTDGRGPV